MGGLKAYPGFPVHILPSLWNQPHSSHMEKVKGGGFLSARSRVSKGIVVGSWWFCGMGESRLVVVVVKAGWLESCEIFLRMGAVESVCR